MFNQLFEAWEELTEKMNRPFYSDREAFKERHKASTQISKEIDLENPYITYDPFAMYTNSFALGGSNTQPINHGDMIRKWRDASILPEVDEAITEISSEAIVFDEIDNVIDLNLDDVELPENIKSKIHDSFDKIMYLLDFNERGEELFKQWYVDSTLNIEVVYNNRKLSNGIMKLILLPPFDIQKYKNEKDGTIRWFINKNQTYNPIKDLENAEITYFDEQITQINSGILSPDKRMYYSPIQKALKSINQLYLLEDTLIIHRLTKSTEKRAFYIDTGNLPKTKAEEYMRGLINKYRQKKIYNTESGTIDNASKSISVLEDFWFPINAQGKGTKVEALNMNNTNFSQFDDINYFIDKVYNALGVPANRRNKDTRITIGNSIDIEKDEMKFFKRIQKLRRRFNNIFVDLIKKDILARKIMSLDDWNKIQEKLKFVYASSNEISMIKKAQILDMKISGANNALGLLEQKVISPQFIQREIMRMTDEEIQKVNDDWVSVGGGDADSPDALGNSPMAGGATPAGFQEVPGAGGAAPAGQPPAEGEEVEAAPAAGAPRFQQKARESGLSKEIIENLREGDIITNGRDKLVYENGKLKKLK